MGDDLAAAVVQLSAYAGRAGARIALWDEGDEHQVVVGTRTERREVLVTDPLDAQPDNRGVTSARYHLAARRGPGDRRVLHHRDLHTARGADRRNAGGDRLHGMGMADAEDVETENDEKISLEGA